MKITENVLKWYGHVKRMYEGHMLRRMVDAPVPEKRRRRKQKDACKRYMECLGFIKGGGRTGQDNMEE